jgi:RsiW-degrading membrane proteinase PrsW (M82 family)
LNNAKPYFWPSVFQLSLSLLAAIMIFLFGGLITLFGVIQLVQGGFRGQDAAQSFLLAASFMFVGGLLLPSAWYALRKLAHPEAPPPEPRKIRWLLPTLLLFAFLPIALFFGNMIAQSDRLAWLFLPVLNLLVTGLPILWLVIIGKRGFPGGSPQRQWGIFASGLVVGPSIILLLELLALLVFGLIGIFAITQQPHLMQELMNLATRLRQTSSNPDTWLTILTPYMMQPVIIAAVFIFISIIVPLIEEAFKPIGLWFIAGRNLTPTEGFVGGLLSGAGFALFENLGNTSTGGATWALQAGSRITTALLHIITAGLTGWALSHAWSRGRYFRLAITYTFSVALHGIWNGLAIAGFFLPLLSLPATFPLKISFLTSLTLVGLGLMAGFNFIFYLSFSRGLRHDQRKQADEAESNLPLPLEPQLSPDTDQNINQG